MLKISAIQAWQRFESPVCKVPGNVIAGKRISRTAELPPFQRIRGQMVNVSPDLLCPDVKTKLRQTIARSFTRRIGIDDCRKKSLLGMQGRRP